jgi:BolA protein
MSVREQIEEKLRFLAPERVELVNESHLHRVPAGSESHWNLILVADAFAGQSPVDRHRAVHRALGAELQQAIHALTIKALTPGEWRAAAGAVANPSPPCRGGSRAEGRDAGG